MADIDDELLALAGGESSDEEEVMSENESRAESMSPPSAKKKDASKAAPKKAPAKKAKKRARQEDSEEEEGEASSAPSSPNSLESAPMDESDSDAEPRRGGHDDDDEEQKYPVDGMFVSLAEKEKVMSMREVERESLLADRQAEIEKQRQNRMLRLLVTKQENEEKKQKMKKRTADAADLDDGQRKTSRQRTRLDGTKVGETNSAIDTLRRARAEKNDRARRREEDRERNKDKRSPNKDFGDDSGESEDEWGREKRHSRTPEKEIQSKELPPPGIRDFERIRVGKSHFAEYCFNPGFSEALSGCYVRIFLGQDGGEDCYRMALIKGFSKGRPYAMTGPSGGFVTDQYVTAAHGKAVKEFPFIFCSDRAFTEREFNRYKTTLEVEGLTLPKTPFLVNKIEDINKFTRHHLTSDEIDARIAAKTALRKQFDPKEREKVARQIEEAKARGKTDVVEKLQEHLDELMTNRLAHRTQLTPVKASTVNTAQQERLAEVNRERRRKNAESVSKAQLKERVEARKLEAALARGENLELDLSRRLRTRAKFVHDVNESAVDKKGSANGSGTSTPATGTPKLGAQKQTLLPHIAKLQAANNASKNGLPTIHRPLMDDDIIAALDLDIDVEID